MIMENKKWVVKESVGSMLGRRIAVLKEEGYTDQQIKNLFDFEYRRRDLLHN